MKIGKVCLVVLAGVLLASLLGGLALGDEIVLTAARPKDGESLNPITAAVSLGASRSVNLLYNQLVNVDPEKDFNVVPGLLTAWETEGYTTWIVHVREGVTFHDDTSWNAEALKFNLDMWAVLPEATFMVYAGAAGTTEVLDEYTVKIELKEAVPLLMDFLQTAWCSIISPTAIKDHATTDDPYAMEWLNDHEAGTGPFILESWEPGERMVVRKWENYWGGVIKKTPKIDRLIYLTVPDAAVRMMMLEKGDIDLTGDLSSEMIADLEEMQGIKVEGYSGTSRRTMIFWDITAPPFDDLKVRQAINYAINYDEIIDRIDLGYAEKLCGMPAKGYLGASPELAGYYTYDLEKAKQLMSESKYADGFEVDLMYDPARYANYEDYALYIQSYLSEIGIKVNIKQVVLSTQTAMQDEGDYGMGLMLYSGDSVAMSADAVRWQYCSHLPTWGWRGSHWTDDTTEVLCPQALATADRIKRAQMYREIDLRAHELAVYVWITQLKPIFAMQDNIVNFRSCPPYQEWFWQVEKK